MSKDIIHNKAVGFYFIVACVFVALVSLIRFLLWAPSNNALDLVVIIALLSGIAIDVVLIFKDNDYLTIAATTCYSIATVKLLTNSVGSFVDAFQGINMFGDATQVPTILSISIVMAVCILLSIITAFLKRVKD